MRITTVQSQQYSGTSLQRKLVAAIFGGKMFRGSVYASQQCHCSLTTMTGGAIRFRGCLSVRPFINVYFA